MRKTPTPLGEAPAVTADRTLDAHDLHPDPIVQFQQWFGEAVANDVPQPDAVCVASIAADGTPDARMVLLKAVDERGFVFYTNYESEKGEQLSARPGVALVWHWSSLRRQVRVRGRAVRVAVDESDAYFMTRDRGSQLSAWASRQSAVLADRAALDGRMTQVEARFSGQVVPRPPWWGGIRVAPTSIEFWQGRTNRLHDRLRYQATVDGWRIDRLAP
jgi:pyridoxamine 5'-phosphate oxidase